MTRRIGVLSVSMAALGLAVAGYFVQGAGAGSSPVEVADFGGFPATVAVASGGDEYDMQAPDLALFHPASVPSKAACAEGTGLGLVSLTDDIAILCKGSEILGYIVAAQDGRTKLVDSLQPKEDCPSVKHDDRPDA